MLDTLFKKVLSQYDDFVEKTVMDFSVKKKTKLQSQLKSLVEGKYAKYTFSLDDSSSSDMQAFIKITDIRISSWTEVAIVGDSVYISHDKTGDIDDIRFCRDELYELRDMDDNRYCSLEETTKKEFSDFLKTAKDEIVKLEW